MIPDNFNPASKTWLKAFSVLLVLASVHWASVALCAEEAFEVKVGVSKRIPCAGAPELSFDLFIPSAYMKEKDRKFPVLYLSSSNAKPDIAAHTQWAERRGVVLITINDSQNGPWAPIFKAQDAVWKTTDAALRLHPCLRFSMGMSGAASASLELARHHKDNFAGVVLEGHSGEGESIPKHLALAFIHGDKEPNIPFIDKFVTMYRKQGNPTRCFVKPGGHVAGSREEEERFLDWMFDLQRFAHPSLSADDKARAKADVLAHLADGAAKPGAKERFAIFDSTLALPGVSVWPESKPFLTAWLKAALEAAESIPEKSGKYAILGPVSFREWYGQADAATRTAFEKAFAEVKTDPAVKINFEADGAYATTAAMEKRAGENAAGLSTVKAMYDSIAKKWPETAAGKNAVEDVQRLSTSNLPIRVEVAK